MGADEQHSGRFAIIPTLALEDERLTGGLLRLLCIMGTYGNKYGYAWPSLTAVGERMRPKVSPQAVSQGLHRLEKLGWLEIKHRSTPHQGSVVNLYRILFDKAPGAGPHQPEVDGGQRGVEGHQLPEVEGHQLPEVEGHQLPEVEGHQLPEVERNVPSERPSLNAPDERPRSRKSGGSTRASRRAAPRVESSQLIKTEAPDPEPLMAEPRIWADAMRSLRPVVSEAQYDSWFKGAQLMRRGEDTLIVECTNPVQARQLDMRWGELLRAELARAARLPSVDVTIAARGPQ